jgi:chromosome segregation ATPase
MRTALTCLNFFGVLVLAVLLCVQWKTNSRLEAEDNHLEQLRVEQSAKIADQEITLKQDAADLDDFRQRLSISESSLKSAIVDRDRLAQLVDELKKALDQWKAAVAARDEAIQKIAAQRNDAITKFNDLADKYNTMVKQ